MQGPSTNPVPRVRGAPTTTPQAVPSRVASAPCPSSKARVPRATKRQRDLPPSLRESRRARLQQDELGKRIRNNTRLLRQLGWRGLIRELRQRGDLEIQDDVVGDHPAKELLHRLAVEGAPAVMKTKAWSRSQISERIARGSHKSCQDHMPFLREELLEFDQKGFWLVLPASEVRRLLESGEIASLRVSPMGVIPQRDRRPRLIVDLSFYGVNDDTLQLAPSESMQFGRALERLLYLIRHSNPRFGPVHMGKVDLSDGFYRIALNDSAIAQLAVALPKYEDEDQLLALPLVLPMGWVESPPWFCVATETVADIANHWPHTVEPLPHPLEGAANTPPSEAPG